MRKAAVLIVILLFSLALAAGWGEIANGRVRIKDAPNEITLNQDFQLRLQAEANPNQNINNQELHIFLNGRTIGRWNLPTVNPGMSSTESINFEASCKVMYEEGKTVYFEPGQKNLSLGKTEIEGSGWSGEIKTALDSVNIQLNPPKTVENRFQSSAITETPGYNEWINPPARQIFKVKLDNEACVPLEIEVENVTINGDRYSYSKTGRIGVKTEGSVKVRPRITGEQMYEWGMTPQSSTIENVPAEITYSVNSPKTGEKFTGKKEFTLEVYNTFKYPNNNFGITDTLVSKFPKYRKYKINYEIKNLQELKQETETVELAIGKSLSTSHGFFRSGIRPSGAKGSVILPLKNGERIIIRVTGWADTSYRNSKRVELPQKSSRNIETRRYEVSAPEIPVEPEASIRILSSRTDWGDRIYYEYQINNPRNFWAVPYFVKENGERIEIPDNRLNSESGERSFKLKDQYTEYFYDQPDNQIQVPKDKINYLEIELQATNMAGIEGRKTVVKDRIKIDEKAKVYDPQKDNEYISGSYQYNNQDISNFPPKKIPEITGFSLDSSTDPDKYDIFVGARYYKERGIELEEEHQEADYVPIKPYIESETETRNRQQSERGDQTSIELNATSVNPGNVLKITVDASNTFTQEGYNIVTTGPSELPDYNTITQAQVQKTLTIPENTETGTYTVKIKTGTNLLGQLWNTLTGKDWPSKTFTVTQSTSQVRWKNYCQNQDYNTQNIQQQANCIENDIVPEYFEDSTGPNPAVAESLCQDLLGYTYSEQQHRCTT